MQRWTRTALPSEYGNALVMEGTAMADEMELAGLIQGVKREAREPTPRGAGHHGSELLLYVVGGDDDLKKTLVQWVRKEIGPVAAPDLLQFAPGLPKTRSGKIMRRILRKIAEDDFSNLGDTSTLADPSVVEDLIENRQNK